MTDVDDPGPEDDLTDITEPPLTATEEAIRRVVELVETARPVPLSTSAMINREEILALLDEALENFPREMRESRWLLKERTDFLAKARSEAEDLIVRARARVEQMVQRSEVVREADRRARQILDAADAESRRLLLETDDFCDRKLGSFEILLERTAKLVQQGREKLQIASEELHGDDAAEAAEAVDEGAFFDQDRS